MEASPTTGAPRAVRAAQMSAEPAIEVGGLDFSYGDRQALCAVEFTIARGEIFGFLGPNGGGKSTLFRLLSTLVPIQSGNARILGYDLRGATQALRRKIGVVFQSPSLDGKLTVAENLAIHGNLYGIRGARLKERTQAMLARLDVSDRAGDLAETLSGGLRRRVELAKALLHEPELLLLDEPSTGLDPAARREFFNLLARLRESDGVTIVLTTHYMEEAERCDRIGILDQGRLVAIAPPGELKQRVGGDVMVITRDGARSAGAEDRRAVPGQRGAGRRHAPNRTAARTRIGGAAGRRIRRRNRIGDLRPAYAGGRFRPPDGPSLRHPLARGGGPLMGRVALQVWTLWWREIVRFRRQRSVIIGSFVQPLIFWVLIGWGFRASFKPSGMPAGSTTCSISIPA